MSIKEMVSNWKRVQIFRYKKQEHCYNNECGFEFPVPISDTSDAAFAAEDKAILFMRWMKKHVDTINAAKQDQMV
jgi:hypothetical protein